MRTYGILGQMKGIHQVFSSLAFITLLGIMLGASPSTATAQERNVILGTGEVEKIILAPGHTLTVRTNRAFNDMVIGNSDVADVFPLSDSSLYIQGIKSGFTNIAVYDENKNLLAVFDVRVRRNLSELSGSIKNAVPSSDVTVSNINDRVRLSGTVKDNVDLEQILAMAGQYSPDPVLNAIRVRDAQQVTLQVRVLEVERNSGRALGVGFEGNRVSVVDGETVSVNKVRSGTAFTTGLLNGSVPFGTFVGGLLEVAGLQIDVVIQALEAKGVARRLANPSLTTVSGSEANFVVGGEVPITKAFTSENGSVATETAYREFGVKLNFTPTVLDDGLVRLRVRPEVSDVDFSNTVNGAPTFVTRSADTTVMLRDGQGFAIAGLLQASNERNIQQLPWLGNIPVLGTLFKSTSFQKNETDLVILVTPKIVRPARQGEPLRSPLDQTRSSDDVELFLLGMLEVDKDMIRGFHDGAGIIGPYGHIIDLEFDDGLIKKK